ncbi:pectate lyase-like [Senna tora]|uniref:Pectate lyase n=1 Tax=Senna tora TaxID=362788 RepID=A0A834SRH4_9FABA|nr:pectate lyase-like [Senna tora]
MVAIPTLYANVLEQEDYWKQRSSEFDAYWQEKAKEAEKANLAAYDDKPYEVVGNLSESVERILLGKQDGRRLLKGKSKLNGPCEATNPIDACWRCDPNWANYRQKLADCVQGFGRKTVGGKGGPYYVVTDPSDSDLVNPKVGTLRHAVTRTGPLWIIFARSMVIRLTQELIVASHKTIDGRGATGLIQRMPRCRWGFVHVVNNDYTHWIMYAIGGSKSPTIISEGNRFIAPDNIHAKEVTKREYSPEGVWKNWQWRSINDLFMNGAYFRESGIQLPVSTRDMLKGKPGTDVSRLTRYAGNLKCIVGRPC